MAPGLALAVAEEAAALEELKRRLGSSDYSVSALDAAAKVASKGSQKSGSGRGRRQLRLYGSALANALGCDVRECVVVRCWRSAEDESRRLAAVTVEPGFGDEESAAAYRLLDAHFGGKAEALLRASPSDVTKALGTSRSADCLPFAPATLPEGCVLLIEAKCLTLKRLRVHVPHGFVVDAEPSVLMNRSAKAVVVEVAVGDAPREDDGAARDARLLFDAARALRRGKRGSCLAQFVAPDLLGARSAYASAFAQLDARGAGALGDRVRASYAEELAAVDADIFASGRVKTASANRLAFDETLRSPARSIRYDTIAHDLSGAAMRLLEVACLESLHTEEKYLNPDPKQTPPISPALLCVLAKSRRLPKAWSRLASRVHDHINSQNKSPEFIAFRQAYRAFVETVVVGALGCPVAFQCPPTLRIHLVGARPLGRRHRDRDYAGHTGDEVNFWVPLTAANGHNSLFVESKADKGDFEPLNLAYGEAFIFDGENCEHHTVANDTETTRVSLDFRVIPLSRFRNDFGGRIGSYPVEITAETTAAETTTAAVETTAETTTPAVETTPAAR